MSLKAATLVACSVLCAARAADGAIIVFTDAFLYDQFTGPGSSSFRYIEDFGGYAGTYAGPVTGQAGPVWWSASSLSGIDGTGDRLASLASSTLRFDFSSPNAILGIAGNFFATNASGTVVPSLVQVSLADGTSYLNLIDSSTAWVAFYSTGAQITGIEISAQPLPGGPLGSRPTVDNLDILAVPGPGALALLGLGGLVRRRRR